MESAGKKTSFVCLLTAVLLCGCGESKVQQTKVPPPQIALEDLPADIPERLPENAEADAYADAESFGEGSLDEDAIAEAETDTFPPLPPLDDNWVRLDENSPCWLHRKAKQVAIDGEVCLTRGYLEMFACKANTKEHESVVALNAKAQLIHAALLAAGAKNGSPATFSPSYAPATGTTIEVFVEWRDVEGKMKKVKAQEWVRDLTTKKPMTHDWVFGGSSFWTDPETKESYYRAEGGELICVSNFPTAMMDLPIESSQTNEELAFEAFTENIPKRRTPVRVYLAPKLESK